MTKMNSLFKILPEFASHLWDYSQTNMKSSTFSAQSS